MITLEALAEFAEYHVHRQSQEIMRAIRRPTFDMPNQMIVHDFVETSDWELTMIYKINGHVFFYGATIR